MVLLTVLTIVLVLLLVGVLVTALVALIDELGAVGGEPTSLLAKVRWGVRAIEQQTSALGPQVKRLNAGLDRADEGLASIHGHVRGIVDALERQGGAR